MFRLRADDDGAFDDFSTNTSVVYARSALANKAFRSPGPISEPSPTRSKRKRQRENLPRREKQNGLGATPAVACSLRVETKAAVVWRVLTTNYINRGRFGVRSNPYK